jgi:uncharacterized protein (DUF169 family)
MNFPDLTTRLTAALDLTTPPAALSFADEAPDGVADAPGPVPSACSFWMPASQTRFYATAQAHHNCPVGTMVMGFAMPDDVQQQLGQLVGNMFGLEYLSQDEPSNIPTVPAQHAGIVYGPLSSAAGTPDVVLVWVTPRQAMLCNEAMGTASWAKGAPSLTGRPGCAAIPVAMSGGAPAMTLGCVGMRTFTQVPDDRMMIAIPGGELESFVGALEKTGSANSQMQTFYEGHRDKVTDAG